MGLTRYDYYLKGSVTFRGTRMGTGRLDGSHSGEVMMAWTKVMAMVRLEIGDTRYILKILRWEK